MILTLLLANLAGVWASHGQTGNTISFSNLDIARGINAPFYDADGTTPLSGSNFRAALFWGPAGANELQLAQAGIPQPFRTGAQAGYWTPVNIAIPVPGPGQQITVQVRAWDTQSGTLASFDQALAAGAKIGFSALLRLTLSQAGSTPLTGLTSVSLIPAASTLALGESRIIHDSMAAPNGVQLSEICSEPAGRVRWFRFAFANAGEAVISSQGSSIDTVLAVSASCLLLASNSCTPSACNDDLAPGDTASQVRFQVQTNTTYALAISGKNGVIGPLQIAVSLPLELSARTLPDKRMEISWPSPATQWSLEFSTNMTAPIYWHAVPESPEVYEDRQIVRFAPLGPSRFYRLRDILKP